MIRILPQQSSFFLLSSLIISEHMDNSSEKRNYREQIISSHQEDGLTTAEIRKALCERLENGITVELEGNKKVVFRLKKEIPEGVPAIIWRIAVDTTTGNELAFCQAETGEDNVQAYDLQKYYTAFAPPELRGKGLITNCNALLFQVLREKNVTSVISVINSTNIASIRTKLSTPDIVGGGYFYSEITNITHNDELHTSHYEITTYLDDAKKIEQPQVFDPKKNLLT